MEVTKIAAEGMQRDLLRMQVISQNVANALTPGYKRQVAVQSAFANQVESKFANTGATAVVATAGTLRYTGVPTDIAIEGNAFLEVSTPDGPRYSRQGSLRVDQGGRLVGPNNFPIQGLNGELILSGGAFSIDPSGQVHQEGRLVGQLKLVQFAQAERLTPAGAGTYAQSGATIDTAPSIARIRSGYLENSNVDTAHEMVSLTETVRHFEALHRIAQGYDEVLGAAIRKLGEF